MGILGDILGGFWEATVGSSQRECIKCKYCNDPYAYHPTCTADGTISSRKGEFFKEYDKPSVKDKKEHYCDAFEYR